MFLTLTHTLGREIHYKLFQKFTGEPERGEALGLYCSFFSFVLFYVLVDIFSQEKIRKLSAYCFPTLLQLVWLSLDIVIAREQQVQCHALYCLDG